MEINALIRSLFNIDVELADMIQLLLAEYQGGNNLPEILEICLKIQKFRDELTHHIKDHTRSCKSHTRFCKNDN